MNDTVKFAVFTDLHHGLMHDAEWRINAFIKACEEEKPDFSIQLGDFFDYGLTEKERNLVLEPYKSLSCPTYHALGNHDLDSCSKEEILKLWGLNRPYYSFDCGFYHFIVLDCNYYKDNHSFVSYDHGNYKAKNEYDCFIPDQELMWLEKDLADTQLPVILFSHQCLKHEVHGLNNETELMKVIEKTGNKVRMAINGHNHMDALERKNGILYFNLNSMSNQWLGPEYETERFGWPYDVQHPCLKITAPYRDPLFAIIVLDRNSIDIKGVESSYVGKTPYELKYPFNNFWREGSPRISSHFIQIV